MSESEPPPLEEGENCARVDEDGLGAVLLTLPPDLLEFLFEAAKRPDSDLRQNFVTLFDIEVEPADPAVWPRVPTLVMRPKAEFAALVAAFRAREMDNARG